MIDGFLCLNENGHWALGKVEQRLVEEGGAAQGPVRVALHSQAVLTRHCRTRNLHFSIHSVFFFFFVYVIIVCVCCATLLKIIQEYAFKKKNWKEKKNFVSFFYSIKIRWFFIEMIMNSFNDQMDRIVQLIAINKSLNYN